MLICLFLLCDAAPPLNSPMRWQNAIVAMQNRDVANPPPEGAIFFCGSSSIVLWDLPKAFPDWVTVKRGFGGSRIPDSTFFAGRLILPYKPGAIVFYAGDNDIAAGHSPQKVRESFRAFVASVRTVHPEVPIHFIAIKPSVARWKLWPKMQEANRLIAADCDGKKLNFVDITPPMLDAQGKPRAELLAKDGLHLSPAGYAIWNDLLRKALAR
jgi:lysophospholipase L1-like esterase